MKEIIREYALMIAGMLVFSVGYTTFMLPYQITSGGVSGVAAIIYYAFDIKPSLSYSVINIALLLAGARILGWRFVVRTIIATLFISVCIDAVQVLITQPDGSLRRIVGEERFMACVIGGLMEGAGLALVFMGGGSTGGTDIIASCINKYWNISLGRLMQFLDVLVISSSYLVFHDVETMVIGFVVMLISLNFMDHVMNGAQQSVQFTIISDKHEEISSRVAHDLERGVTRLHAQGWYSKTEREVLLIMARKRESRRIFALIREIDPHAFVTMSNVEGVFGEGFDQIKR
ncbi:MAG: YitT family protein [Bacteroidaceae bacterium]|nr:YitT family protein [Bacteroidaceae bacterium]